MVQCGAVQLSAEVSQVEILSGRLKYKLIGKVYSTIHDKFTFVVSTPKQSSEPQVPPQALLPGNTPTTTDPLCCLNP